MGRLPLKVLKHKTLDGQDGICTVVALQNEFHLVFFFHLTNDRSLSLEHSLQSPPTLAFRVDGQISTISRPKLLHLPSLSLSVSLSSLGVSSHASSIFAVFVSALWFTD